MTLLDFTNSNIREPKLVFSFIDGGRCHIEKNRR